MIRATLALLLAASTLSGCGTPPPADSAPDETFWSHRFAVTEDVAYGPDPAQKLDLYLQGSWVGEPTYFERAPDPRPALIFIHGGGWIGGDKTGQDILFLPFLERGWHVANITYRLGPSTAPAAVDDALCALKLVADSAGAYGIDRTKIVVSGASAGGHLSLTTAILGSRPGHPCYPGDGFRVAAAINWFGITDIAAVERFLAEHLPEFNYARGWVGDTARIADISARYSPLALVDATAPPILTIHGEVDSVVPHSQAAAFHTRLAELGVVNQLLSLPGGKHAGFTDDQFQRAWRAMFRFLGERGVTR
ncbi:MAG: alpha/beta hydrolase fold domain-containing protein [Gemmatimonadales bacterium]